MPTSHEDLITEFYAAGGPAADPATLERVFSPEFVSHTSPPGTPPGMPTALALRGFLTSAFSDLRHRLLRVVVDGDHAATHVEVTATHSGPALGIPPTNRQFVAQQMHMLRFADDGRIAEHWGVRDDAGMMRQLTA
jgi:predicted ester cyclase